MADDMTLKMMILARGSQAIRVLKMVNNATGKLSGGFDRVGAVSRRMFSIAAGSVRLLLAPLKLASMLTLGLTLAFGGLSAKALGSAGEMESLDLRLQGVTATVQQAKKAFEETKNISIASPFTPGQLVEARIQLMNVGIMGKASLISIGDAAAITQREMVDLVSAVTSLETEPLRRLGIESKKAGNTYEMVFRDKMQNVKKVVFDGVDAARRGLLSIFDVKYGGGMAKFMDSWLGVTSTFKGNVDLALASFGKGMAPAAKDFVRGLNDRLVALTESGKLEEMGAKIASKLQEAWDYGADVLAYSGVVIAGLNKDISAMPGVMNDAFSTGGQMIAVSLVNYLRAAGSVFVGLGHLIAAGLSEQIMSGIGLSEDRRDMISKGFRAMNIMTPMGPVNRAVMKRFGNKNELDKMEHFNLGIKTFKTKIPGIAKETKGAMSNLMHDFTSRTSEAAGVQSFEKFRGNRIASRDLDKNTNVSTEGVDAYEKANPMMALVKMQKYKGLDQNRQPAYDRHSTYAPQGKYSEGEQRAGGTIISIQNLQIRANDAKKMQNDLLRHGHSLQMPAST